MVILRYTMAELFDSVGCTRFLVAFCNQPEAASDVTSGRFVRPVIPDKEHFQRFLGKTPFGVFLNFNKWWQKVAGDVISGVAVD